MNKLKKLVKRLEKHARDIEKDTERARKELSREARTERRGAKRSIKEAKKSKSAARKTKENLAFDIKMHRLEKGDVKEAVHEMDELKCATGDAAFVVKTAERIQKKRK